MSGQPGQALARALAAGIADFGGTIACDLVETSPWASLTFSGARHRLCLRLLGPGAVGAAADFLADMADRDVALPGHILADIALLAESRRDGGEEAVLDLEALTLEDR